VVTRYISAAEWVAKYETPAEEHTGLSHDLPLSTEEHPIGNIPPLLAG
jgi:hypothetical protein